jgi:hypothetical protein
MSGVRSFSGIEGGLGLFELMGCIIEQKENIALPVDYEKLLESHHNSLF